MPSAMQPGAAAASTRGDGGRPSAALLLSLAGSVLVLAGAGYAWTGAGLAILAGGVPPVAAEVPAEEPQTITLEQIEARVESLAQRLKTQPQDLPGWTMLSRSYAMLKRYPQAAEAYRTALSLSPDDPALLIDYADVLAIQNDRKLAGEPIALIERALKKDPGNVKGLVLAGAHAFEKQDYAAAVRRWEKLLQAPEVDAALRAQLQPVLEQARQRAADSKVVRAAKLHPSSSSLK